MKSKCKRERETELPAFVISVPAISAIAMLAISVIVMLAISGCTTLPDGGSSAIDADAAAILKATSDKLASAKQFTFEGRRLEYLAARQLNARNCERTYRVLIRVVVADGHRIGFVIPAWNGGKKKFYSDLPLEFHNKVGDSDYMFVRTQLGSDDYKTMTFDYWEYPEQLTDEDIRKMWKYND